MLNKIKKLMGFNSKNLVVTNDNTIQQPQNTPVPYSEFSLQELEILLIALKECNLKGSQIELFYNLVLKIQNKYLSQK
jgi:hypothetical protein